MSSEMQELTQAIQAQTSAINNLVQSNAEIIALMTECLAVLTDDGVEQEQFPFDLSGKPIGG